MLWSKCHQLKSERFEAGYIALKYSTLILSFSTTKYRHWLFLLQLFNVLGVFLFWFGLGFFLSFGTKVVLSVIGVLSLHFLVKMCEPIMVQAKPTAHSPQ